MQIRELTTEEEWRSAFPVMRQLRTHLDLDAFLTAMPEMRSQGYRLFAVEDGGAFVSLAGIAIRTNLYYGRYLWVYDLVTDAGRRSRGYGAALLAYLEDLARRNGCGVVALSSGVQRQDAHRFYEQKMAYQRVSYVFKKSL